MREELAALCHDQWSHWMKYLFSKSSTLRMNSKELNTEINYGKLIPKELVDRWERQMYTPYEELTEKEKESDRKEADKFINLIGCEECKKRMLDFYCKK